jgi:hypothetical protein
MSNVQTAKDDARPQDSAFHNQSSGRVARNLSTIKNWHCHDPPILFPVFITLLIVGYAVLRTPQ